MSPISKNEVEWGYILNTIMQEKCVLMIGPDAVKTKEGVPLREHVIKKLKEDKGEDFIYYDKEDFILFENERDKLVTYFNIQNYYQNADINDTYEKIAKIPFDLTISISPDLKLKETFEKHNYPFEFNYYKKYESSGKISKPTKDFPVVYNLFGSVDDDESLIFTHDDLFDFMFAILGDKQLPDELKHEIKTARNIIFLGFKFEHWYVKLLLRLFNLHSGRFLKYASGQLEDLESSTLDFYKHHFRLSFIDTEVEDFVDHLYELCETKGVLRNFGEEGKEISIFDRVKMQLADGELSMAVKTLQMHFNDILENDDNEDIQALADDIILLSGGVKRLQKRYSKKLITEEDYEVQLNKYKQNILDIIEEAQTI